MNLLNKKTIAELEKIFGDFKVDVAIKYFGDNPDKESRFCRETRQLIEGVTQISPKLTLQKFDFEADKEAVEQFGITRTPALVIMDEKDYGIRFYGVPSGYEFSSLIESFKLISSGQTLLVQETRDFLDTLDQDVHLQIFVTPTCPHCPTAVVLGHRMAYYSQKIRADMIEATEYPELAQQYSVMGVPRTIINETGFQEGAAPEDRLVERIKATIN
jgi:glutaredoxin-like protein